MPNPEHGNKAWKVQVGKRVEIISRDCQKTHLGSVAPKATMPPKHGRPRTVSVAAKPGLPLLQPPGQR